ncbi:MAG: hypothetical protein M3Q22_04405 [Actinomycetota bacterium]|nr:hypothetical protein [Actinomycetota bacterium]
MRLPAEGRAGRAPAWPLAGAQEPQEAAAWAELWRTPQAVAWERLGWSRTVARYCRVMVASEQPGASPALLAQATALEDRLGLTPKAMRLLLWEVVEDEVAEQRTEQTGGARTRLKAVDPDAVARTH